MARLTLPRIHKETARLVKMSGTISEIRVYLQSLIANPRGGDAEIAKAIRVADNYAAAAHQHLAQAISEMAFVAKTLERRKAVGK